MNFSEICFCSKTNYAFLFLGCFVCTIPLILNKGLYIDNFNDYNDIPATQALSESEFQFSVVASLAAVVPIFLDIIADSYFLSIRNMNYPGKLEVLLLIFSIILTSLILLFSMIPGEHIEYIPTVMSIRSLVVITCSMFILNVYGKNIWSWKFFLPTNIIFICSRALGSFIAFSSPIQRDNLLLARNVLSTLFAILIFINVCRWIHYIRKQINSNIALSIDDKACALQLLCWVIFTTTLIIFETSYGSSADIHTDISIRMDINKVKKVVKEAHGSCEAAVDILNDLLIYERLDRGPLDLNISHVHVKPFVRSKIKAFVLLAEQKKINLSLKFCNTCNRRYDRAFMKCDEEKLGQVLRNIVSNAIECTPHGGRIIISVDMNRIPKMFSKNSFYRNNNNNNNSNNSSRSHSDEFVSIDNIYLLRIQVKDTGPGIS
eukprot:gene13668-29059_t